MLDSCLNLMLTSLLMAQLSKFRVWSASKIALLGFVEGGVLFRLLRWCGGEVGIS